MGVMKQLPAQLRKDAWLLAALAAAVLGCLLLGAGEGASVPRTDEEARLARVLSAMEGAGQVEVAVFYDSSEESAVPCGVVVVADGAQDVAVRLQLSRAVETLLGVDASQVDVFKRREGP
ncbi:MAG: hypothetical protein IKK21_00845 [Clostridia bacterium]|nr:hypothetical protein [Clostridia bacterium]